MENEQNGKSETEKRNDKKAESPTPDSSPPTAGAEERQESGKSGPHSRDPDPVQLESAQPSAQWLDAGLLSIVRTNWETLAWAAILITAVVSRFYALGERGMSHDESLHSIYSLYLYRDGNYQHDPMMHGPFLFHTNAFIYFLFGVSDTTARILPALAGIGIIIMAWFYRRWFGRVGALLVGLLLLLSPSLLFHSRYIRNDIYIVFFSMIWAYAMFRFIEERKLKWLYLIVTVMALGFASKENLFMSGAIFGIFLAGTAFWRWRTGREPLRNSPFADLAVLLFTVVLPFATGGIWFVGHEFFGWNMVPGSTPDMVRSAFLVLLMTGASVAVAYWWFKPARANKKRSRSFAAHRQPQRLTFAGWAALMGLFWAIEIVLFTTFFTNPVNGFATGVVGSLGYWLAQQGVHRGSQPWYYYMIPGMLYEFLPIFLSLGGMTLLAARLRAGGRGAANAKRAQEFGGEQEASGSPRAAARVQPLLILFLAWWAVAAWTAYSSAGEKMPWLMTHMAHPMALLGGWWGAHLLKRVDWRKIRAEQGWWALALLPALLFMLATLFSSLPVGGRDTEALAQTTRFILAFGGTGGLLYLVYVAIGRFGWRLTARLAAVSVLAILLLLTVRFSYLLAYVNYDMATEYLIYAHASPDVKLALREIETISERTVGGREIKVSYDDDVSWPMTWYMSFFPNSTFYGASPSTDAMSAPVILVGDKNYDKVEPYVARDYVSRNYRLIWWPDESYKGEWDGEKSLGLTFTQIWSALTEPEKRDRLWQIFFFRNHPDRELTDWPHRRGFRLYVRKDIADIVWDLNVVPTAGGGSAPSPAFDYAETDRAASVVYSDLYDNLPLSTPRDVAVGPDGRRIILDSGNNRVVVLAQDGSFLLAFGSACFLSDGESGGCVDPDGGGPLELGDGQFREPWGVAVGADGAIFVADTWNGRIQVFDSQGRFLRKWGVFTMLNDEDRDPYAFFGPRGLAVLPTGNLLVADTGHKRIVEFTADGEAVRQVGGGGILLGHFEEPVGVAVHPPTGNILVSDAWNRRIQVLSADLEPLAEWPMPTWESKDIWDKPFVAAAADGTVFATDPQFSQVFTISASGVVQTSFGKFGSELNRLAKPTGIAIDPLTGDLLIADADNNRILTFVNESG